MNTIKTTAQNDRDEVLALYTGMPKFQAIGFPNSTHPADGSRRRKLAKLRLYKSFLWLYNKREALRTRHSTRGSFSLST
jgi:hypothetical protein